MCPMCSALCCRWRSWPPCAGGKAYPLCWTRPSPPAACRSLWRGWGRPLWPCRGTRGSMVRRARACCCVQRVCSRPPLLAGGTGSMSALQAMPDFLPDRLEAGTHNIPGIAGLLEGLRYVRARGTERILRHEQALVRRAAARLSALPGVEVFASDAPAEQAGVLSFRVAGRDCEELGEALGRRESGAARRAALRPGGPPLCRHAGDRHRTPERLGLQHPGGDRPGGAAAGPYPPPLTAAGAAPLPGVPAAFVHRKFDIPITGNTCKVLGNKV